MRQQRDPRGKVSRWLSELEDFDYSVVYIPGQDNVMVDALSRNYTADLNYPDSQFENKIYTSFLQNDTFLSQLSNAQSEDPLIRTTKDLIENQSDIVKGQLKRVKKQLRIEQGLLTK